MTTYTCELCHNTIDNGITYDACLSVTLFDEAGEITDSLREPDELFTGGMDNNYIAVGTCCKDKLIKAWNKMVSSLVEEV